MFILSRSRENSVRYIYMSYLNEISSKGKRQALIFKPKIYDILFRNKIFVFMFICYYNLNPTFEIAGVCG